MYVYIQSTTVYAPSSELGLPQPLSRKQVCPPPRTNGWGTHSPPAKGWGSFNSDDWKKNKALCLHCMWTHVKGHADELCSVVLQYIYLRVFMNNALHKENMCRVEV
jgi:hypothetical protein